jgi:hypothetical protein
VTFAWAIAAVLLSSQYVGTHYSSRTIDQRSNLTIPHLGIGYFGVMLTSTFLLRRAKALHANYTLVVAALVLTAYTIATVVLIQSRTQLIVGVSLTSLPWLARARKIRARTILLGCALFIMMIPVFDFMARARAFLATDSAAIGAQLDVVAQRSLSDQIRDLEFTGMAEHADRALRLFPDRLFLGRFIGLAIVTSPPAFVLRVFGLEETRSLGKLYAQTVDSEYYAKGGGYGLALSAEAYLNFGYLGGIALGLILFVLLALFERAICRWLPGCVAIPVLATFMVAVARVNRNGVESLPKIMLTLVVFVMIWRALALVATVAHH